MMEDAAPTTTQETMTTQHSKHALEAPQAGTTVGPVVIFVTTAAPDAAARSQDTKTKLQERTRWRGRHILSLDPYFTVV